MRKIIGIFSLLSLAYFESAGQACPEKINWKKEKSEIELSAKIKACLPVGSSKASVESFLVKHKTEFSDYTERIIYASAQSKSGSLFVSKKWLMEFLFDQDGKLIEYRLKEGYTGL